MSSLSSHVIFHLQASEVLDLIADRRSWESGFRWWCWMRMHVLSCPLWLSCSGLCQGGWGLWHRHLKGFEGSAIDTVYARSIFPPDQIDWCSYLRKFTKTEIRIRSFIWNFRVKIQQYIDERTYLRSSKEDNFEHLDSFLQELLQERSESDEDVQLLDLRGGYLLTIVGRRLYLYKIIIRFYPKVKSTKFLHQSENLQLNVDALSWIHSANGGTSSDYSEQESRPSRARVYTWLVFNPSI